MYKNGDFHIHTTASDGKLSPREVVKLAHETNLDIISITDHDTTNGIDEAIKASKQYNIKVIPGIELSVIHNDESVHILGYFKDESYKNKDFQEFLNEMKTSRIIRAEKIIHNLYEFFNIKLDYNKILNDAKGVIARPHIAQAIIDAGYNYSWDYIFDNIINKDSPAYVHNKKISIPEGIDLLKRNNALVFLAHPVLIKKSNVESLMNFNFDGIEAIYPLNNDDDTIKLTNLAKTYNKLISAGSDFHSLDNLDTKHFNIGHVHLNENNIKLILDKLNMK